MSRMSRTEFENRFLGDTIDLSPREVAQEESSWVIELESLPYERTATKLKGVIERNEGGKPIYLQVGATMVKLGDIQTGVGIINEIYQTLKTLGVKITENGEEIDRMLYLSDAKLPPLTESDFLV